MASAGQSDQQIAINMCCSLSAVVKRKRAVRKKVLDFLEGKAVTTIYINGNRYEFEDLKNQKIEIEYVRQALTEKLTER